MSASEEMQEQEREVLLSIYDGDENFKAISDSVFQYKFGEDGHSQSLLLEISWGDEYPNTLPKIHLDAFYNKHILPDVKENVLNKLYQEAEQLLGWAMTYTLFEWAKENREELMAYQPEVTSEKNSSDTTAFSYQQENKKPKERKEQLTKSQKRRIVNRIDLKTGERPRGWDWVDVVKHLSQTGAGSAKQIMHS